MQSISARWDSSPLGFLCLVRTRFFVTKSLISFWYLPGRSVAAPHDNTREETREHIQPLIKCKPQTQIRIILQDLSPSGMYNDTRCRWSSKSEKEFESAAYRFISLERSNNIGIHFFDMLQWIFGEVDSNIVHLNEPTRSAGE